MSAPRRKRSPAWTYYVETGIPEEAQCFLCKEVVKRSGNTSNMIKHLKSKHLIQHGEIFDSVSEPKRPDMKKQASLDSIVRNA